MQKTLWNQQMQEVPYFDMITKLWKVFSAIYAQSMRIAGSKLLDV